MKLNLLKTGALALALFSFNNYASEMTMKTNINTIEKATYIPLESKAGANLQLEQFLQKGSQLVRQTEPGTPLWFGLKENNNYAIFDLFYNEQGREQHFSGQVAQALQANAKNLVNGGWEKGVIANVNNFDIIANNNFSKENIFKSKFANLITLKAKPGKSNELKLFLQGAAKAVQTNEPQTYFWLALKTDKDTYAIFDTFPNSDAQKAHFSGAVAVQLKLHADELIIGGWEQGVLANLHSYEIIALS